MPHFLFVHLLYKIQLCTMAKIYQMEETSRFNDFSQRIRGGVLLLSTLSFGLCVKLSEV